MISGNPDERLAFVIETEARLDGLRQARSEIAGFSAAVGDNSRLINTNIGAFLERAKTVNRTSGAALQAFRQEGDALSANLARLGATETEINKIGAAIARVEQKGGAAQIARSFDPVSNRARTAANAFATLGLAASGATSNMQGSIIAAGALTYGLASLSSSARIVAGASGIGAIITVAGALIPLLMRMRSESELVAGAFGKAFGGGDEAGAGLFLKLAQARRAAAQSAYENAGPLTMGADLMKIREERKIKKEALDQAVKDEQAAIDAVFAAQKSARNKAREEAQQAAKDRERDAIAARAMGNQMRGQTIQLGHERTAPELAAVTAVQMEQAARDAAIKDLQISTDDKNARLVESERLAQAQIGKIYDDGAEKRMAKADDEARKLEDIEKRKAGKRLSIARENVHALVMAEGSILQTMKRLALEPVVAELEGIAAKQAVKALASAAEMDFRGAAMHAAAAAAAIAAARTVAGWAGSGTKGGGGAGSGSGSGAGSFEPRQSTAGQGMAVINLYSQNPYGPELIQQVKYQLERADVMKRPGIEIPPTTGIRAA